MSAACATTVQGLQSAHAYTILDTVQLTDKDGKQWDLMKMRNPWASETYSGAWSDVDGRWTEDLRRQVGHSKADDGVFFLPINTFKAAFPNYYIGMY